MKTLTPKKDKTRARRTAKAVGSGPLVQRPGLFNLYVRHTDGRMKKLTGYAMTHHECCVMKSKLSEWSQARTLLVKEDGK